MNEDLIRQVAQLERRLDGLVRPEVAAASGWELISETVLGASAASVTFSSISASFRHLVLIIQARTDRSAELDAWLMRFNSDSGNNYDNNLAQVNNDAISGISQRAISYIAGGICEGANSRANSFYPSLIWVLGYGNTNSEKWAFTQDGAFGDVSADADLYSNWRHSRWRNTNAITSIALVPNVGPNFVANSIFTLYGIV